MPLPVKTHSFIPELMLPENVAKDFYLLKDNIQKARATRGTKIITVTSAVDGEGCSTVAYFLTLMLSQSIEGTMGFGANGGPPSGKNGKNGVLLMDANVGKPILHHIFGVNQKEGLKKIWLNGFAKNGRLKKVCRLHLHLLTACSSQDRWKAIVHNGALRRLISDMRDQFEYVIIDAPPVIGHPETLALSKISDGVLLVLKAKKTPSDMIAEVKRRLRSADANILGAVLNDNRIFNGETAYSRN